MKKTTNRLLLIYYCIYVIAIAIAVAGYYFISRQAPMVAEMGTTGVTISSIYIIFLIASVPLSLKLFNIKVKKLSQTEISPEEKLKKYFSFSMVRLAVIGLGLLLGIVLFYLLNSRSMIFCAAIAAIALVFCKPTEVKMANELDLDNE